LYEVLFYGGLVLAVAFFILTVAIFFSQKIVNVFRFYFRRSNRKTVKVKAVKPKEPVLKNKQIISGDGTELLKNDEATELLEDDGTELL
jgi:hypothetical protein